jgi:ribonuclease HI
VNATATAPHDRANGDGLKSVVIYTDGACLGNPGPGGYGVVLLYRGRRKELMGGFRRTTNNRMELLAVIVGLQVLKERCAVTVYTDSQYVARAMTEGWPLRWRAMGWRLKKDPASTQPRPNADLWAQLLDACARHEVRFEWVKGHSGVAENERCDALSVLAAQQAELPADEPFERAAALAVR